MAPAIEPTVEMAVVTVLERTAITPATTRGVIQAAVAAAFPKARPDFRERVVEEIEARRGPRGSALGW